ncbi:MAG TPA: hypothetical protein V6C76_04765 [Drouetiella sp.]
MTIEMWVALICEETEALEQCRAARERIEDPSLLATIEDCEESHRLRLTQLQAKSRTEREEKFSDVQFLASGDGCAKKPEPQNDGDEQVVFRKLCAQEAERLERYKTFANTAGGEIADVISGILIPHQARISTALDNFSKLMDS